MEGKVPFVLSGDPVESVKELQKRHIRAVSLANNHSMDYGEDGLRDTLEAFRKGGIHTLGDGLDAAEAEAPLTLSAGGRKVIFLAAYWHLPSRHECGYYAMPGKGGAACIWEGFYAGITRLREVNQEAIIIVLPHWGRDYVAPLPVMRGIAEQIIAAGADMIIGHGSHTISPVEYQRGKPVIYSLGNFVFNSNGADFMRKNSLVYGFVCRLLLGAKGVALRLYPIYTYNPKTFWQPHPASAEQCSEIAAFLRKGGLDSAVEKDELGHFFPVPL
jgi:poly-gamma-glutamate capsule biosynthesis protein CapA/YwtB (metallophosphatase superfamily)